MNFTKYELTLILACITCLLNADSTIEEQHRDELQSIADKIQKFLNAEIEYDYVSDNDINMN